MSNSAISHIIGHMFIYSFSFADKYGRYKITLISAKNSYQFLIYNTPYILKLIIKIARLGFKILGELTAHPVAVIPFKYI